MAGSGALLRDALDADGHLVCTHGCLALASRSGRLPSCRAWPEVAPSSAGTDVEDADGEPGAPKVRARALSRAELKEVAKRQGLDLNLLLADIQSRGIQLTDDEAAAGGALPGPPV
jgi:hypothetical protein